VVILLSPPSKKSPIVMSRSFFYIEGDGLSFKGKHRISDNPTPRRQMLIKLAAMDQRPNVVYVARPCQYTPMELNPKCNASYWTDKRMSDDSVEALNEVINKINSNNEKFSLVGYSGGGGIAVLIAARNPKVKDIITIAANLDHEAFNKYHNVTPMNGSLNPINYAKKINNIPQLHLSGGKDNIVLPFIAEKYVQESASNCAKQKIFQDATHKDGWDKIWSEVYTKPVKCGE
jgi:pimeloyl-ACP methyl ester carboxylesterase